MKKLSSILMVTVLAVVCMTGCGNSEKSAGSGQETLKATEQVTEAPAATASAGAEDSGVSDNNQLTGKHHAEIEIRDYGKIAVELDADAAPITVTNFVKLAKEGFYDGLTFHRIISGFMIQGGDPLGNGTGGSEETIKGEFAANGIENNISHVRGTISMARAEDYNSASSQFFIMHQDYTGLDGEYAGFGKVTEGIEIVDKICEDTPVADASSGTVEKANQPVIERVTILD